MPCKGVSRQRFNDSGCQKVFSESKFYLSRYNPTSNVFVDVNGGVKNHNFKFPSDFG